MSDPTLGHNWDTDRIHDILYSLEARSSCHSSRLSNIKRQLVQDHDCDSPRILSNLSLFDVGNIHYDSVLLHVGKATFQQSGPFSRFILEGYNSCTLWLVVGCHKRNCHDCTSSIAYIDIIFLNENMGFTHRFSAYTTPHVR